MLAKNYRFKNPAGWLVSEKLDGVRAVWNGSELLSREGNIFHAPAWFKASLPAGIVLDGELWIGRGQFQDVVSTVRKQTPIDSEWQQVRFCVFDAPTAAGGFEARLSFCVVALSGCSVASVIPHYVCVNRTDLDQLFLDICNEGGEGVVLRKPGSPYDHCRSDNMLKYKRTESDEAVVIGSEEGEGKLSGMVGALVVKWRDVVFKLGAGLTDALRANPPAIGSAITFEFSGLTAAGVPRCAAFVAERDYE